MYSTHRKRIILPFVSVLLFLAAIPAAAQKDPVLDVMKKELQREMSVLKTQSYNFV